MSENAPSAFMRRSLPDWIRRQLRDPVTAGIVRGSAWVLCGAAVARGLGLLASVVIARMLGREGFGSLGIVQSTVAMFQTFAGFGLGLTAMKHVAEYRSQDPLRAGAIIGLTNVVAVGTGLLVAALLLAGAGPLAERVLGHRELAPLLRIGSLLLLLSAIGGAQAGALAGLEAFPTQAVVGLVSGLLALPLQIGGAAWGGVTGALWGYATAALFSAVISQIALRRRCLAEGIRISYRGLGREKRLLWRFSVPAVLTDTLVTPVNWVCSALLVGQPGGLGQMGFFNAANQWQTAILLVPRYSGTVLVPSLSRLRPEPERYRKGVMSSLLLNVGIASALAAVVILGAPLIVQLYGADFAAARPILVVVALTAALTSTGGVGKQVLSSQGRLWWRFGYSVIWAAVVLLLSWWLVPRLGALGMAWAMLAGALVVAVFVILALLASMRTQSRSDLPASAPEPSRPRRPGEDS